MLPSSTKDHHNKPWAAIRRIPYSSWLILLGSALLWLLFLCSNNGSGPALPSINFYFINNSNNSQFRISAPQFDGSAFDSDPCFGRYVYIQRIPAKFNSDLLRNCSSLNKWIHMCRFIVNSGLGPPMANFSASESGGGEVFSGGGWYWTNQFSLEIIFHERMKRYECLTDDSSKAAAVFVPYYAGLDVSRYLWESNVTLRDAGSVDLARWLRKTPEWKVMGGRDHFVVAGRVAWDFRRATNDASDWGNQFMLLPESNNMTILTIEASTAPKSSDLGIPYPTWFHPSGDGEVRRWQSILRKKPRPYLFSFAGAPRPQINDSIRNELIGQCRASKGKCNLLLCDFGTEKCDDPVNILKLFQSSIFCLQPPGDTLTRRSTFDCMLAGCIPVFFHPRSAYLQYRWHFPDDYSQYSVFIPLEDVKSGKVSVEKKLRAIPNGKVEAMREEVLRLIPSVVYADFGSEKRGRSFEDAFDLALKGVLRKIGFRKDALEGS